MVKRRTGQVPKTQNNEQEKPKIPVKEQPEPVKKTKKDKKKYQPEFSIFRLDQIFRYHGFSKFRITFADIALFTIVTLISAYTHFIDFGEPNRVVFDEVYFGNFTNYYHRKKYFFDIHPPLGKELLYFGSVISGYKADLKFYSIDSDFPNDNIKLLRFWPSLTGTLITPVVYLMLRICDVSYMWATAGAILPALDNMLIVESRFVLIDAYLWFFAALSSLMCACAVRFFKHNILFAILSGIAVGATTSVKFTGAGVSIGVVIAFFMNYNFIDAFVMSFHAAVSGIVVFIGSLLCSLPNSHKSWSRM
ncbi:Dolichyl-phosphate-mannose-protein mannosyltransferase, putative [Trichomonas vaginalis G3]|uniref:Dolichyl-phosphate-mannose-protein mannosyltransferase, putative n=1 Tax=Trichomonas vaginalis (strain ATCC PRA-98 / G3) TaxID=412133 RepID=A2FZS2_TRIV3|nr:Dolichyl-phosphate-mannose-protein mannosyltransferase, putative [Trichomonas vaginalis G3]|eukprot:XP_001302516.1 Dolichyl-phosphate-mannose-protein mannosyltransferase [Trichomonas vaginalis G3]